MKKRLAGFGFMAGLILAVGGGCALFTESYPDASASLANAAAVATAFRGEANAAAVVCGLTRVEAARYGGWAGDCPGCDVDAQTFAIACESNGVSYDLLLNAQCTAANIEAVARLAIARLKPGGVLILYYSGHGGQVSDPSDPFEADGKSETICLWDGPLRDNVVWALLRKVPSGIRVWMITDSCHSGTNYRGTHSYARGLYARRAFGDDAALPELLHWGGCADADLSYGSKQGGSFTTALVDAYSDGQSYAAWFEGIRRKMTKGTQRPTCEWTGRDFRAEKAFR